MNPRRCDVLNLEWGTSGRDREMAGLVSYALRRKGYRVEEKSIFNWRYLLWRLRPRVVFLTNGHGDAYNFKVVKLASLMGIPVVTLISEGNFFLDGNLDISFWGQNKEQRLYEKLHCQWSERTRRICLRVHPELSSRIVVSGGVGFDRYAIFNYSDKRTFLKKYGKERYSKLIGYAGGALDTVETDDVTYQQLLVKTFGPNYIANTKRDRDGLKSILKKLIESMPDTVFLLKEHPSSLFLEKTELSGLKEYPNVIYLQNEEPIGDCIHASDVWMAYNSTTCLEGWLLGKPTLLINPHGADFARDETHRGSPIFETAEDVNTALSAFYSTGQLPGFQERNIHRKRVMVDTIQWTDGKNHMRAANYIEQVLRQKPEKWHPSLSYWMLLPIHAFRFFGAPYFKRFPGFQTYAHARTIFKEEELADWNKRHHPELEHFYAAQELMSIAVQEHIDRTQLDHTY